jgi:phage shock protein PspC (stress-responsive transcriptional regulator)
MNNDSTENENGEQSRGPERPDAEQSAGPDRPASEQPTEQAPGAEPAAGEQPTAEQPPRAEPAAGDEPTTEQAPRAEQAPTAEQPTTAQATAEPRRLFRSRNERVIAGVCGGLARYLNVDPVIVRVAAVALVFAGGAGLLLYAAAFLLVPNEGEGGEPPEPPRRIFVIAGVVALVCAIGALLPFHWGWGWGWGDGWGLVPLGFLALAGVVVWRFATGERPQGNARAVLRAMAVGVALLILCVVLALAGAWAAADGGDTVVAVIVIAAGLALIAGAFLDGRARWLILPALAVALPAGVVSAADLDVTGGHGEKTYRPASADAVLPSYRLGAGKLVVDLRRADLTPGDHPLKLRIGVGEAQLLVPRDVCVSTDSHLGIGGVQVFDRDSGGIDVDWEDQRTAVAGAPRVVVDANVGIGAFTVHHDTRHGDWLDNNQDSGNEACV